MKVAPQDLALRLATGERALREYEVDAPEWVTLLDVLDIIKDRHDGTLAYPQELPDDDLRLLRDAHGRRRGARLQDAHVRHRAGGPRPVISAMGNLPIVKDLVVDMEPFWEKFHAINPYLQPGYTVPPAGREHRISQERMNAIHKEVALHQLRLLRLGVQRDGVEPDFLGPQALAKAMRFVGDPRDAGKVDAARGPERRARDLGVHALLLLQRALPEGRRPARRDREARRRVDQGRSTATWARSTRSGS